MTAPIKPHADAPSGLPDLDASRFTPGEHVIIALLAEIRDALVPPPAPPDDWCGHPEPARTDLGSMGEEEWICRACRFHYGPVKKEKR
jgi:hypothetical protein